MSQPSKRARVNRYLELCRIADSRFRVAEATNRDGNGRISLDRQLIKCVIDAVKEWGIDHELIVTVLARPIEIRERRSRPPQGKGGRGKG